MGIGRFCMATKTIPCPKCNQPVQLTLRGTQHRCNCGYVIPYKSSPGQSGGSDSGSSCAGDGHKGERSLRRGLCRIFVRLRKGSNDNSTFMSSNVNASLSSSSSSSSSSVDLASSKSSSTGSARATPAPPSLGIMGPTRGGGGRGSSSRPNKRALLCGVSYTKQKYKLKGTHNDVSNMEELLIRTFGYSANCIRILSEDHPCSQDPPTKKNIESGLEWLVDGCQSGDYLVFYFSGHGLRQPDFHEDEIDGFDETICPVDFMTEGMILDNDINKTIVWPLKKGVTLHAIVDACHSGTILDLEYIYNKKANVWNSNIPPSGVRKCTSGGWAISLSACEDDKMAADTTAFSESKAMNGAMTYILTQNVKKNPDTSYGELLDSMAKHIDKVNRDRWTNSRFVRAVFRHKIIQEPLLSSSKEFDVYETKFIL